jgi:hypothetical protein
MITAFAQPLPFAPVRRGTERTRTAAREREVQDKLMTVSCSEEEG